MRKYASWLLAATFIVVGIAGAAASANAVGPDTYMDRYGRVCSYTYYSYSSGKAYKSSYPNCTYVGGYPQGYGYSYSYPSYPSYASYPSYGYGYSYPSYSYPSYDYGYYGGYGYYDGYGHYDSGYYYDDYGYGYGW